MKKIVALLGSPRTAGNSALIAEKMLQTAEALGGETVSFSLYDLTYSGCVACMGCKQKADDCVLQDDLSGVLHAIREADILIMASPVYFGQVTGPFKSAIDRMYSLLKPTYIADADRSRLAPGKHCVFIITQGSPDPDSFAEVAAPYQLFFGPEWFGFETHLIRACGMTAPGTAMEDEALMAEAEELARKLMANS